nr:unnamed protein product [Spirometra erinaceieuropaei]
MGLTYGGISGIYTAAYIYVGFFLWFSLVLGCAVFLDPAKFPLGSFENIYDLINCQIGPEGNYNQSFLTFRSTSSALDTIEEFGSLMVNLVSQSVFGDAGRTLLNIVILSAMATTTTAEVASISNIFINDIYATYLNPFCKRIGLNSCILCGKLRARFAEDSERCKCGSMAACERCDDDMRVGEEDTQKSNTWKRKAVL